MAEAKRLEKRRRILSAAKSLFGCTHDFRRVSLEAIAREARVSPTTIYNNFGNRETLVYEVIRELVSATLEHNRDLIRSELPFPQKLIGVISNKLDVLEKTNGEILTRLIGQDEKITPSIDEIYQREIKPLWQELLAEGKKQGYIDLVLDDNAILFYLDVLWAGFQARPYVLQGFKESMGLFKQLTYLMFYGFLIKDIDLFLKEELHDRKIHHRGEPDLPIRGATGSRPYQL